VSFFAALLTLFSAFVPPVFFLPPGFLPSGGLGAEGMTRLEREVKKTANILTTSSI
jgi:hypothetical protein